MTWIWFAVVGAIGAFLAETVRRHGQKAEATFFADEARVANEANKIQRRKWIRPLSRAGAVALLLSYAGMIAAIILALPGAIAVSVLTNDVASPWFGTGLIVSFALAVLPVPIGIAAMLMCRCGKCAGSLFDNAQPPRKGFLGASRENWRFATGQGRCPRCGAAA